MLKINKLCAFYSGKTVFSDLSFTLPQNSLTALCGVNGSGKSTLLSLMAGIKPAGLSTTGQIFLNQCEIFSQNTKEKAKNLSFLIQNEKNAWDITTRQLISDGRFSHHTWYENLNSCDEKIIDEVIEQLGLKEIQNRSVSTLSGGELQRARIARALVQQTKYILLDEPLTALDINYQKDLIDLLKNLCQQGKTICLSIHDVNLASEVCDFMIMLKKNRNGFFSGSAEDLMNNEVLTEVFGSTFKIFHHPITGKPQIF